ncbi:MAG: cytochrome C biogenesis protein [Thermobacillus sp. ZCTH02-B1]|uniref:cytochrome c biogenesis CcdA family protein n=1 Tax=Thermobacillus sp. ZCTH02-B1 TaxID=1858795 RepID=UPI000B586757|nr:cytochrome c biogenesis protein CcdA [Thermobacillus sp. ZCTH02-B1]OUM96889.1 MAG: cytochrome C biogenesis protein [Thermobacillus sp. ZCTH02-B1]
MNLNVWIALGAGFASFVSPCCLPLYPSYLSYITGISVSDLKEGSKPREMRIRMAVHTLFFLLGFSVVFYTLGYGVSAFADFFYEHSDLIRQIAALIVILMGLFLAGIFQPKALMREYRFRFGGRKAGLLGSFIFGLGFSMGWTPCVGPILAAILGLQATSPGSWFAMTTAYAAGFAIPFFILAFFLGSARALLRYSNAVMKTGGVLLVVLGITLFTDQLTRITVYLNSITPDWLKF